MKKKKLKKILKEVTVLLREEQQKNRDLRDIKKANIQIIEGLTKDIADIEDIYLQMIARQQNITDQKIADEWATSMEENEDIKEERDSYKNTYNSLKDQIKKLEEANQDLEDLVVLYSNELYKQSNNGEY